MSLESEIVDVLEAPLATLVVVGNRVPVGSIIDQWDLPQSDLHALRDWGLPEGPLFRPSIQVESAPVLVPNIAGERERRLIDPNQRLYLLGSYGSEVVMSDGENLTIRVGVVAGSGRVLGVRTRPLMVEDIHPQLRERHPDLYHPSVRFFNSSVAAFVEVAWRWYAAVKVLRRDAAPDSRSWDEFEAWLDQQEACLHQFLTGMVRIDNALADQQLESIWVETIIEDY